MARSNLVKVARTGLRGFHIPHAAGIASLSRTGAVAPRQSTTSVAALVPGLRFSSTKSSANITPDGGIPKFKDVKMSKVLTPAIMAEAEYHTIADAFMERLLTYLEDFEDNNEGIYVEYSAGVLSIKMAPEIGTYVINKQPPTRQIWLSSPKSGPKRYDYVVIGDGQEDKQDTACGEWIYLRDKSSMVDLLREEIGVDLRMPKGDYGDSA